MTKSDFIQLCQGRPVCGECRNYRGGLCVEHLIDVLPVHLGCIYFDDSAVEIPSPFPIPNCMAFEESREWL